MGSLNNLLTPRHGLATQSLLGGLAANAVATRRQWIYCAARFRCFLANIEPTPNQHVDVQTKVVGIIECLNRHFWGGPPLTPYIFYAIIAGSWAKGTRVRPSSDMDLIYLLPWSTYLRYANRLGNQQSDILQEVKNALQASYRTTAIQADGPTVIMKFSTYKVEIAPAFLQFGSPTDIADPDFRVMLCDTKQDGRYKPAAPAAECQKIIKLNELWNGDLIALIRMAKTWTRYCSVPVKSFLLEQMGIEFLSQWSNAGKGYFWYDWMMRDFFVFMQTRRNGYGVLPVSNELFFYGDAWGSKADSAARAATRACTYEELNQNALAGEEWQKIFGYEIPRQI